MHFWIDKRSQACGFGRARVSASLSGAGAGVGLGFGHPPRRIGGGNKSFTSVPTMNRHQHVQQQHQMLQQNHHHHQQQQQSLHHQQQLQQQQQLLQLHQHQQQHQHRHQHNLQCQQSPNYSSSSSITATKTIADCHARSCTLPTIMSNNNNASSASTTVAAAANNVSRSISSGNIYAQQQNQQLPATQQQTVTHTINNNAHQQQQQPQNQQQHQLQQQPMITCSMGAASDNGTCWLINGSSNNNNSNNNQNNNNTSNASNTTQQQLPTSSATGAATTAAALRGTAAAASHATSGSDRYNRNQFQHHNHHRHHQQHQQSFSTAQQHATVNQLTTTHHHYDTRSYHHPQFGNMSVRHYQCAAADSSHAAHTSCRSALGATTPLQPQTQQVVRANVGNHPQFSAVASYSGHVSAATLATGTRTAATSSHECRSAGQTSAILQQHLHSPHLPHVCGSLGHAESSETGASVTFAPIHTTRPLHSHQHAAGGAAAPQRSNISNGNMRATITHNGIIDDAETQPMLAQLKCGLWTALVIASVFVAGAKFYFDSHGTGLEVIIFCTFSATFFLAACTVSLCRLPKSLVTPRHLSENSRAFLAGSQAIAGGTTNPAASTNQHHSFGQANEQRLHVSQERSAAAHAGPPPYHIAILLPEHRKDAVADESPPPSYDKILI